MSKIKAAVCHQFTAPLQIETVELRSPLSNEIEVQLGAVAICHSDIAFAEGLWGGVLPAVYGHEAAGVVTEVGDSVRGIPVGDHVVVTLIRACGHCLSCATGQPTSCETPQGASASPLRDQIGKNPASRNGLRCFCRKSGCGCKPGGSDSSRNPF